MQALATVTMEESPDKQPACAGRYIPCAMINVWPVYIKTYILHGASGLFFVVNLHFFFVLYTCPDYAFAFLCIKT